jgi:hypothetical protein
MNECLPRHFQERLVDHWLVASGIGDPPKIDFYLLLDNSPSMAVAATPADVTTNATSSQGGCAFACHESDPAADSLGNPEESTTIRWRKIWE